MESLFLNYFVCALPTLKYNSGPRVPKFFYTRPAVKIIFTEFRLSLELALVLNAYITLYLFLSRLSTLFCRKQSLKGCPKNRYYQI